MSRRRGWTALLLAAALLVGCSLAGCGSPGGQHPEISVPQLPQPLPDGWLVSVAASTANVAWAVGYSCGPGCGSSSQRALIVRWDGTRWAQEHSPSPGITSSLGGVAIVSAHSAWAVGNACMSACGTEAEIDRALILHWNGTVWATTASPPGNARLYGVDVAPHGTAWAVGDSCSSECGTADPVVASLILRWDGTGWHAAATPVPGAELQGISVGPGGTAWAVGYVCLSLCDSSAAVTRTLALYWDGSAWTQQASPSPGGAAEFSGVAAGPGGTAWAVGSSCTPSCSAFQDVSTLIAHWDGSSWSVVGSTSPGLTVSVSSGPRNDWLAGQACATGCGTDAETEHTLLMRWTGASWSPVPSPTPYPVFALLSVGADASGPAGAWAVGSACTASCGGASEIDRPLILHWNGRKWLVASR